jgi:hypothetical protein
MVAWEKSDDGRPETAEGRGGREGDHFDNHNDGGGAADADINLPHSAAADLGAEGWNVTGDDSDDHDEDESTIDDHHQGRELDRELEEMFLETQRQLEDELQRQIDEQLDDLCDRGRMDEQRCHLTDPDAVEATTRRRRRLLCDQGGSRDEQQQQLGLLAVGSEESHHGGTTLKRQQPTVGEINAQIQEIVARYASTITLGSSEHEELPPHRPT